ncbi:WD repeat-containing protein 87-like [Macrobrachium nipponense]|uniref:WD repeat-containing protein 87-like n=1 Tax=Macrobrachium nipponense TaxID=159736 RepID=UPI0030C7FB55
MNSASAGFGDWCALPLLAVFILFILFTGCDFFSFTGRRNIVNNLVGAKESNKEAIQNVRAELKDKIEILEYENDRLKKVVLCQIEATDQRNSEIESLIDIIEGILPNGTDSREEEKDDTIREEGKGASPKCDARLEERLRHLILEMSSEMVALRMDMQKVNQDFNEMSNLAITRAHQIDEKANEISELNGEVLQRQNYIEELVEEIHRKDERHREMENQLVTANEKIVALQRELLNQENKTELLEKGPAEKDNKIESLTCKVHRAVDGKVETSQELEKLRGEMATTNIKIDRLQEENCLKEQRISEVERRLEQLASQFEERDAAAAETLKMEGQEERLRKERHSQGIELCEISPPFHQSLLEPDLVIELGRLKEQLSKDKERRVNFTRMGGHEEILANEDLGQLQRSEAIDSLSTILECLHSKDLEKVLGSTDVDMQSLSEAIGHLLKLLTQEKSKDRAAATQMVADLQLQKRLLGFTKGDMTMKAHLDTHIHVLKRARGKDIQIQMDKILECKCQSKPAAEDVNIPKNSVQSSATQEEEVLLDPKYAIDELISTQAEVLATKEETSSIANEVLGTTETVTSSEDFIFVHEGFVLREEEMLIRSECIPLTGEPFIIPEHLGPTAQSAPVVPEDLCLTPQATPIVPEDLCPTPQAGPIVPENLCPTTQVGSVVPKDLCLIPEAAPIVQENLLMTKERDAFQIEGASFSGVEQAIRNEREALNMERLAHIREKEAFAAEREAFNKNKEKLDEYKDALQREMATFYREKEEFDREKEENKKQLESFTKKLENIACHWQDKKEILDKQEEELLQEITIFEEKKKEFIQEREEFQKEKEAIYEKEQVTIECMERLEKTIVEMQERRYLNWNVTGEREVQMEQKIKELEEIIEQLHVKLKLKAGKRPAVGGPLVLSGPKRGNRMHRKEDVDGILRSRRLGKGRRLGGRWSSLPLKEDMECIRRKTWTESSKADGWGKACGWEAAGSLWP